MPEISPELAARIEQLRSSHRENPARFFMPLASAYREAGELGQAEELLRENLKRHPGYLSAHVLLGRCLADRGALGEARNEFSYVLSIDPQNLIALRTLGEMAASNGNADEARRWYGELLAVDPMSAEARQALDALESAPPAAPAREEEGGWDPFAHGDVAQAPADEPAFEATRFADEPLLDAPGFRPLEPAPELGFGSVDLPPPVNDDFASWGDVSLDAPSGAPADLPAAPTGGDALDFGAVELSDDWAAAPEPAADPSAGWGMFDDSPSAGGDAPAEPLPELRSFHDEDAAEDGVEMVTETMAELYYRQGFVDRAADVYRELIARRGQEPALTRRLAELEAEMRGDAPGFAAQPGFGDAPELPAQRGFDDAPEFPAQPGFPAQHGFAAEPGFDDAPGLPAQPGFAAESGFAPQPGFADAPQPGFGGAPEFPAQPGYAAEHDAPSFTNEPQQTPSWLEAVDAHMVAGDAPSFQQPEIRDELPALDLPSFAQDDAQPLAAGLHAPAQGGGLSGVTGDSFADSFAAGFGGSALPAFDAPAQPAAAFDRDAWTPPTVEPTAAPAFDAQPAAGFGTEQAADSFYGEPSNAFDAQSANGFDTQPAGEYDAQPANAFDAQPAGEYDAQPANAFDAQPAGEYDAQPVDAFDAQTAGDYDAQPAGEYDAQPADAYDAPPAGGFDAQPANAFDGPPAGGFDAQPGNAFDAEPAAPEPFYADLDAPSDEPAPLPAFADADAPRGGPAEPYGAHFSDDDDLYAAPSFAGSEAPPAGSAVPSEVAAAETVRAEQRAGDGTESVATYLWSILSWRPGQAAAPAAYAQPAEPEQAASDSQPFAVDAEPAVPRSLYADAEVEPASLAFESAPAADAGAVPAFDAAEPALPDFGSADPAPLALESTGPAPYDFAPPADAVTSASESAEPAPYGFAPRDAGAQSAEPAPYDLAPQADAGTQSETYEYAPQSDAGAPPPPQPWDEETLGAPEQQPPLDEPWMAGGAAEPAQGGGEPWAAAEPELTPANDDDEPWAIPAAPTEALLPADDEQGQIDELPWLAAEPAADESVLSVDDYAPAGTEAASTPAGDEPMPWEVGMDLGAPEPAPTPAPAQPVGGFSFEDFFSEPVPAPAPPAAAEPQPQPQAPPAPAAPQTSAAASDDDEDLESFQAWLQSLKR